ncbi:MAG TPA: Clp protease N-terminal domain-containing protein, partial [Chroococcales cyanobacterium]
LSERDGIAYKALSYAGLTNKEASERVKIYQTRGSRRTGGPRQLSKAVLSILKQAGRSAEPETPALTPEMMLRAIIAEGHGLAQLAFEILDIDPDTLEKDLALCISGQPGYS